MFVDSHAHLYFESLIERIDEVIQNAISSQVTLIINVGVELKEAANVIEQTRKLNQKYSKIQIFSTIGIHPHEATKYHRIESISTDVNKIRQLYESNKDIVKGIGECGLDFFFKSNPSSEQSLLSEEEIKKRQKVLLKSQIELAQQLNLPVVIHCRDAWAEILPYLEKTKTILHCYSGNEEITRKLIEQTSHSFSFAANITYPKNDYLRQAAANIPLNRILTETDAPFLSPQHMRGETNEPANVTIVAQTIANIKEVSIDEFCKQVTQNTMTIFS